MSRLCNGCVIPDLVPDGKVWKYRSQPTEMPPRSIDSEPGGAVYAISNEFGVTKVGKSALPIKRIKAQIAKTTRVSGRPPVEVAISHFHAFYDQTEKALHRRLRDRCVGTELFFASIDEIGEELWQYFDARHREVQLVGFESFHDWEVATRVWKKHHADLIYNPNRTGDVGITGGLGPEATRSDLERLCDRLITEPVPRIVVEYDLRRYGMSPRRLDELFRKKLLIETERDGIAHLEFASAKVNGGPEGESR